MNTLKTVQKITPENIEKDYFQVMIPYKKYLTFCNDKQILFHDEGRQSNFMNKYPYDIRRLYFSNSYAPVHKEKKFFQTVNYTNQILDIDKPYFSFSDGQLVQAQGIKVGDDLFLINQKVLGSKRKTYFNKSELQSYLKTDGVNSFILNENGEFIDNIIPSSDDAIEYYKNEMLKDLELILSNEDIRIRNFTKEYIEYSIKNIDTRSDGFQLNYKTPYYLLLKWKKDKLCVKRFRIKVVAKNVYELKMYDIAPQRETLEIIKDIILSKSIKPRTRTRG